MDFLWFLCYYCVVPLHYEEVVQLHRNRKRLDKIELSNRIFATRSLMQVYLESRSEDDEKYQEADDWFADREYIRPARGWLAKPISRLLGPAPSRLYVILDGVAARDVRTYTWQAFGLVIAAIITLLSFVHFVPALAVSPLTIYMGFMASHGVPWWIGAIIALSAGVTALRTGIIAESTRNTIGGKPLEKLVAEEELWFRSGSENWSVWQRISSCFGFGLMHVFNFIYPVTSIIVLMLVGGVFMFVYLRAFRRTGSTESATIEATRFHAAYDRFAIAYTIVAIGIALVAAYLAH